LFSALRQDLTDIAAEIKKSYEYTLCCYPRRRADTLVLTGGGACIANLSYFFHHLLGIPVSPAAALLETDRCRLGYTAGKRSPLEITALAVGLSIPPEARA
jgi:Tfp pilus assembly PilM family ATPase